MPGRILIAGCGYVGSALAERLVAAGHTVFALRRRPRGLPAGVEPVPADLSDPGTLRGLPPDLAAVCYTASADRGEEAAYRAAYVEGVANLLAALPERRVRLVFTSSTGVYAQREGEWVDEASPAESDHFSGRTLREGERLLERSGHDAVVLRLGGIYGPGRTRLVDRVRSGEAELPAVAPGAPPLWTNRIHLEDCAGALAHLLALPTPAPLYLGVDSEPAEQATVLRWLAGRLGVPEPKPSSDPPGTGPASRPRGSKRCRNRRLLASGYRLRFPDFRAGYDALLRGMGLALAACALLLPPILAGPARAEAPPAFETALRTGHPLVGKVWDVAADATLTPEELRRRLASAPRVLLGERHDQPDHHRLQAWLVRGLVESGRRPDLVFEMLLPSQAEAFARHRAESPDDVDGAGAAMAWEERGWPDYALYRPLFATALAADLPVVGAAPAAEELRIVARGDAASLAPERREALGLDRPLPPPQAEAIADEIRRGHCGHAPEHALPGMVRVQQARDGAFASALLEAGGDADGAVLVAGNGHVRRDHGVPARIDERAPGTRTVAVALLEVDAERPAPADYADAGRFDYVWFTPRVDEVDPCERFREQLEAMKALPRGEEAPEDP